MRSALTKVDEIQNLETSPTPSGGTCSFHVHKDFDYETKLNDIVDGGVDHLKDWTVASK